MARPKSDDKRQAILDAALKIFAERGIAGAPTSAISREAGVAEGSLFTYFKTKDDLLNELHHDLRMEFSRHLDDFPHDKDTRSRLYYIWQKFLQLGAAHPEQLKVLTQLRTSGKLLRSNETPSFGVVQIMKCLFEATEAATLDALSIEYLVLMMRAQLEITVEFINANPDSAARCSELGFKMLWSGLAAQ